jgi:putative SOS response-associated peptidase YedK
MPVVIARADLDRWLHGAPDEARALLVPAPADALIDTEVGKRVSNARNDDPACLDPARPDDAPPAQAKLFS